jgi:hypothetical protein
MDEETKEQWGGSVDQAGDEGILNINYRQVMMEFNDC